MGKKSETVNDLTEMKPSIYLTDKDLPVVKKWQLGETYRLVMDVKLTSLSQNQYDDKKRTSASFELQKVTTKDRDMKNYLFGQAGKPKKG